jgi:hypothetical protein
MQSLRIPQLFIAEMEDKCANNLFHQQIAAAEVGRRGQPGFWRAWR